MLPGKTLTCFLSLRYCIIENVLTEKVNEGFYHTYIGNAVPGNIRLFKGHKEKKDTVYPMFIRNPLALLGYLLFFIFIFNFGHSWTLHVDICIIVFIVRFSDPRLYSILSP